MHAVRGKIVDAVTAFPVFELGRFEAGSAEEKHGLGAEVDAISGTTGFLVVSGHGVPKATLCGRRRRPSSRFRRYVAPWTES